MAGCLASFLVQMLRWFQRRQKLDIFLYSLLALTNHYQICVFWTLIQRHTFWSPYRCQFLIYKINLNKSINHKYSNYDQIFFFDIATVYIIVVHEKKSKHGWVVHCYIFYWHQFYEKSWNLQLQDTKVIHHGIIRFVHQKQVWRMENRRSALYTENLYQNAASW